MTRHTKIVATLGPASNAPNPSKTDRAGVDVVRLNFSHGKTKNHIAAANTVREIAAKCRAVRSASLPICKGRKSGLASLRMARSH